MEIRLAAPLQSDSVVDGFGVRTVIWTQGCSHNCPFCQNPSTHSFTGGALFNVEDIKEVIREEYRIIFEQQTSLPAVNIGHLATKLPYQCRGIGSFVVNYVLSMLLSHKATGVQFITVDSLNNPKTNKFYMNNGFLYQTNEDIMAETRRMFLSLIEYIE